MWMEVTEQEAALIAKLARNRNYDLTMSPREAYPGEHVTDWQKIQEKAEQEKALLRAIGDKAVNVQYAQSVRHTVGADAFTEEAAQWLRDSMIALRDLTHQEYQEKLKQVEAVLTPLGLEIIHSGLWEQYGVAPHKKPKR